MQRPFNLLYRQQQPFPTLILLLLLHLLLLLCLVQMVHIVLSLPFHLHYLLLPVYLPIIRFIRFPRLPFKTHRQKCALTRDILHRHAMLCSGPLLYLFLPPYPAIID